MVLVLGVLTISALAWCAWLLSGGHLFWVGSPSMGMVAPVGSLVLTKGLAAGKALHVGEIIVFRPRPTVREVFIHRIYRILTGQRYMTKGDLNPSPDPWIVPRSLIAGTPVAIIPAIGWAYKLSAWLFFGAGLLVLVSLFVRGTLRRWLTILGPVLVVILPVLRYRILINSYLYGARVVGRMLVAKLVSSGVLPVRFSLSHGHAEYSAPGQEVTVRGVLPKHHQHLLVGGGAALPWWGWVIVGLICLCPLLLREISLHHREPADQRLPAHRRASAIDVMRNS